MRGVYPAKPQIGPCWASRDWWWNHLDWQMSLIESVLQNRWISCGLMNLHLHYLHDLKNHWLPKRNDWIKSQFQMTISVVLFLMPWFWEPHCHLGKAASFMWLHVGKGFKCSILIYFTSFLPVGFVRFPFMAGFLFVHYYAICFNIYIYRHRSLICLYIYTYAHVL